MNIIIYSTLAGKASGYIVLHVPPNCSIGSLLKMYCSEKGINVSKGYVLCGKENAVLDPSKTLEEEGIQSSDTLKLSQDNKKDQLFAFGSWWILSLVAFIIGAGGLAFASYHYFILHKAPLKYGIVIDAGSTHSQLFVFSWPNLANPEAQELELVHDCIMSGGIAEFRTNTEGLVAYFEPCFGEAENFIPASARPKTPLILAATGGMRILKAFDPDGADFVLSSIREYFSKTNFLSRSKEVYVASGQQEGISGWTALNYLMENFQENEKSQNGTLNQEEEDVQASALDLGGASVQVTTELSEGTTKWPTVNITILNNTYTVYSKSFLCYGIGTAMHRFQYLLVKEQKPDTYTIDNPCLPKGLEVSFTSQDFHNPCIFSDRRNASIIKISDSFAQKYVFESTNSSVYHQEAKEVRSPDADESVYILKGTSNSRLCEKRVGRLFDYKLCKKMFVLGDCLNKKAIPPYEGELVGFSSIFDKLLPLLGVSTDGDSKEFKNALMEICSLPAETLRKLHPHLSRNMLQDLCFDGMYVYSLLQEGLGVTEENWEKIFFTTKVKKQEIVWAMGLMLNRTGFEPGTLAQMKSFAGEFSVLVVLFSLFLITSVAFLIFFIKIRRRGNVYQRVPANVSIS